MRAPLPMALPTARKGSTPRAHSIPFSKCSLVRIDSYICVSWFWFGFIMFITMRQVVDWRLDVSYRFRFICFVFLLVMIRINIVYSVCCLSRQNITYSTLILRPPNSSLRFLTLFLARVDCGNARTSPEFPRLSAQTLGSCGAPNNDVGRPLLSRKAGS